MVSDNLFGSRIREIRQRKAIPIKTVCERMCWSTSYLMDLEKGRSRPPSIEKIKLLSEALLFCYPQELIKLALLQKGELRLKVDAVNVDMAVEIAQSWATDIENYELKRK